MTTKSIQVGGQGGLLLPTDLQEKYGLKSGDTVTLIDLDSLLVISPRTSRVAKLAGEIEKALEEAGLAVDELLDGLADERARYTEDKYGMRRR